MHLLPNALNLIQTTHRVNQPVTTPRLAARAIDSESRRFGIMATEISDSFFKKWISSGDISEAVNFLAHLFHQGYQHRSLNSYRSAISSVHDKVDGYEVGQHPLYW